MHIRPAAAADAGAISALIRSLAHGFTLHPEGVGAEGFLESVSPGGIEACLHAPDILYRAGWVAGELAGVVAVRGDCHLHHLFVAPKFQRMGLARQLWRGALAESIKRGHPEAFTVNSTPSAVRVYESFGFAVCGPRVESHGIAFVPMRLSHAESMAVSLRAFQADDARTLERWAGRIGIGDFMSRTGPRSTTVTGHAPGSGIYWFVILEAGHAIGTVWIEPGGQPSTSVLGIFLGDRSAFGHGLGTQAIRLAIRQFREDFPGHTLTLNVRQSNHRAQACYLKVGFSVVARLTKASQQGEGIPIFQMDLEPGRPVA